ncbi:MAG: hypothetical protein KDB61_14895, partial [Planctomycetes bacterium]|nr:hypothetical protein [Planctomycetota bacterium]
EDRRRDRPTREDRDRGESRSRTQDDSKRSTSRSDGRPPQREKAPLQKPPRDSKIQSKRDSGGSPGFGAGL